MDRWGEIAIVLLLNFYTNLIAIITSGAFIGGE